MPSRRYTIVVADRRTGVYRRFTLNPRPVLLGVAGLLALPVLIGLGLKWSARVEIQSLRADVERLDVENRSYRTATGSLTSQIQSLQTAITDIGEKAAIDGPTARAMANLPAVVRSRAVGGGPRGAAPRTLFTPGFNPPEDTFGVLRDLLVGLESRLRLVENDVDRRQALASATPSIWPTNGWLTDSYGSRKDPFTGEPEFHQGLDISTDRGQPVLATADGIVAAASRSGAYGNMVVVDHGFGISTRYAHLSAFQVEPGARVKRGDVVGLAGATGRATGTHVHYEVLVHGSPLNPLRFLLNRPTP